MGAWWDPPQKGSGQVSRATMPAALAGRAGTMALAEATLATRAAATMEAKCMVGRVNLLKVGFVCESGRLGQEVDDGRLK